VAPKPLEGVRVLEVAQFTFVAVRRPPVPRRMGAGRRQVEHPAPVTPSGTGASPRCRATVQDRRSADHGAPTGASEVFGLALESRGAASARGADSAEATCSSPTFCLACAASWPSTSRTFARQSRHHLVAGSGFGSGGPDRDTGGYDATAYWARGGSATA